MIWDKLDFFIVIELIKNKKTGTTTWGIAKKFNWSEDISNLSKIQKLGFYTIKTHTIQSRIENMVKEGLILKEKNSRKNIYTLILDRAKLINNKYDMKEALKIIGKDNKIIIFEL